MSGTISIIHPSDGERRRLAGAIVRETPGVRAFATVDAFVEALAPDSSGCVVVPSDLPGRGTRALIDDLRGRRPSLHVVVLGRDADLATAVEFVRAGAIDYLAPPLSLRRLLAIVRWSLATPRP